MPASAASSPSEAVLLGVAVVMVVLVRSGCHPGLLQLGVGGSRHRLSAPEAGAAGTTITGERCAPGRIRTCDTRFRRIPTLTCIAAGQRFLWRSAAHDRLHRHPGAPFRTTTRTTRGTWLAQ